MFVRIARTPLLALAVGICLELSVRNGICDDNQVVSAIKSKNELEISNGSLSGRHDHLSWTGWENWLPTNKENNQGENGNNHYIPLSPSEQAKLRYRRNRAEKKDAGKPKENSQSKSSKTTTEKSGAKDRQLKEGDSPVDIKSLRDTATAFASSVMNHFLSSSWLLSSSNSPKPGTESEMPRSSRGVYLDNLGERQDGPNFGKPVRESKRGVIDWLSRLIGVQGKTLGEFLREYQVHVLYDLAFTFFKWIFFLYAGLLIP